MALNLLLADDDQDDCMFFKEALEELLGESFLTTVNDGEELMELLSTNHDTLPDLLFLDLNMPRKNGFECLSEIKLNERLRSLPVVVFSTSFDRDVIDMLYENGAQHYIRKPGEFSGLKKALQEALKITCRTNPPRPSKENFVIQV